MAILTTVALVLGTIGPQEPAPPVKPASAVPSRVDPLRLVWPDAIAIVGIEPTALHAAEMETTGLPAMLKEQLDGDPVNELIYSVNGWLEEELGLAGGELLEDVGRHGMTVAWRPAAGGSATWLAVLGLDDSATPLADALDRAADSSTSLSVSRAAVPGASAWTLKVRDLQSSFVCVVDGQSLIVASDVATARDALARGRDDAARSLANAPRFRAFRERLRSADAEDPLVVGWLDLGALLPRALATLPNQQRSEATEWFARLGLDQIGGVGFGMVPRGGRIHERFVLDLPAPRPRWLEALLPSDVTIDQSVAGLATKDVVSFGVTHLRIAELHAALLAVLDEVDPDAAASVAAATAGMREMTGVDIVEAIGALGDRLVTMQWPDGDQVLVVDLADPRRLSTELRRLQSFESSRIGADELFLPVAGGGTSFAISRAQLVVASDRDRLRFWLDQQRTRLGHPEIQSLVQSLPANAIGCGWSDFRAMAGMLRSSAGMVAANGPAATRQLVDPITELLERLGDVAYDVSADERGYVFHVSGSVGGLSGMFAGALGMAASELAAGSDLRAAADRADALRARRLERLHDLLARITDAEREYHAAHAGYAGLDALIRQNHLSSDAFAERVGEGRWRFGEHVVEVVLDRDPARSPQHFAVFAWPTEGRRGDIYAATDRHPPMRNELIARNTGLTQVRVRDLFTDGDFEGTLSIGWRTLEVAAGEPPSTRPRTASSGERTRYEIVAALEVRGAEAGPELVPYLDDESNVVVARAAWAIGEVRHEAAVPRLVQLVRESTDADVRRHAMRALWKTGDARSVRVSIEALADDDARVREIAAVNLGALRAKQASEFLLGLVAREPAANEAESNDRSAALLALGEFGDASVLVPAATALRGPGKLEEQSLTWTFQKLSPTLAPEEEARTLMAVLDHESTMLRRYAIQRLGELQLPVAEKALEGRLGTESRELRQLVEVSLTAIRGTGPDAEAEAPPIDLPALWAEARAQFEDPRVRAASVAGLAAFLVVLAMFSVLRRRARRRAEAAQWSSMVEPSRDFRPSDTPYGDRSTPRAGSRDYVGSGR